MLDDIQSAVDAVNDFLTSNGIQLNQNQFDALVSFTHQYGENWWSLEGKKLPQFIIEGNGTYDPDEVMEVFLLHDNKERRREEAEVFINGYE